MTIQKTIALASVPLGLLLLLCDPSYLLAVITRTGLDWHGVFLPVALGIITGCLAGILKLDKVQRLQTVATYLSTALFTLGVVGSVVIYIAHSYWFLAQPALWLATVGIGLYMFFLTQAKFSNRYKHTSDSGRKR